MITVHVVPQDTRQENDINAQEEIRQLADMRGWDYVRTVDGDRYLRGQDRVEIMFKSTGSVIEATRYEGFNRDGLTPAFSDYVPARGMHGKKHLVMRWLMAPTNHPTPL